MRSLGSWRRAHAQDGAAYARIRRVRRGLRGLDRPFPIKPGCTVRLPWSVVFGTPLDVTHRVSIVRAATFKDAKRAYEADELERTWKASTRSDDC